MKCSLWFEWSQVTTLCVCVSVQTVFNTRSLNEKARRWCSQIARFLNRTVTKLRFPESGVFSFHRHAKWSSALHYLQVPPRFTLYLFMIGCQKLCVHVGGMAGGCDNRAQREEKEGVRTRVILNPHPHASELPWGSCFCRPEQAEGRRASIDPSWTAHHLRVSPTVTPEF